MELTRSRGSSVWSRQEAKLGDNLLSYLVMPPLSTPYGAVAAYRSISRQPYKVYWKILQHLQHNSRRGHCTWRVHPLCNRQPCYTTQASITSTTHGGLAGHTMPQALPPPTNSRTVGGGRPVSGMSGSRPRPYAPPVRGQLPPARGQLPAPPFGSSPSLLAALPRASSGFGFLRPLPDRQGEPLLRVQAPAAAPRLAPGSGLLRMAPSALSALPPSSFPLGRGPSASVPGASSSTCCTFLVPDEAARRCTSTPRLAFFWMLLAATRYASPSGTGSSYSPRRAPRAWFRACSSTCARISGKKVRIVSLGANDPETARRHRQRGRCAPCYS